MDLENFIKRLKLFDLQNLATTINAAIDELIMGTYPSINLRQCVVLRYIIQVIWDVGFSNASYDEVVVRLLIYEKQLFPSKRTITETISELCEKGVLMSRTTTYFTYTLDGILLGESRDRVVLDVIDKFRTEAMCVMTEIVQSFMSRYLSPESK